MGLLGPLVLFKPVSPRCLLLAWTLDFLLARFGLVL